MNINLRILFGADNRLELVKNTIKVCAPYFSNIKIINSGLPDTISKSSFDVGTIEIENLNYFTGNQETHRRSFYCDIPYGDWVLWLDSDECPTETLLQNLHNVVELCETKSVYNCRIPFFPHIWEKSEDGTFKDVYRYWFETWRNWPTTKEEFVKTGWPPAFDRLFKRSQYTCPNTNFGGHGGIHGNKYNLDWEWVPYAINHYKDSLSICQSFIYHTFTNPCTWTTYANNADIVLNSDQYKLIRKFQIEEQVFDTNALCYKLKTDMLFKSRLKSLLSTTKFDSGIESLPFNIYKEWAEKYDLSVDTIQHMCGASCCKYGEVQL